MYQILQRILIAAALALVVVACDTGTEVDGTISSNSDTLGGSISITDTEVTGNEVTVSWDRTGADGTELWYVYRNDSLVCSGDSANATGSSDDDSSQSFSCELSLQDGSNSIYVEFCQSSGGSTDCLSSATTIVEYDEQQAASAAPGDIALEDLAAETSDSHVEVSWTKASGVNGDYWNLYHNNQQYCSGNLSYNQDYIEQSGGCTVALDVGSNQFQAELCRNRSAGLDDICSQSQVETISLELDPARSLATPVIIEPTEELPAERDLNISWSKDTSTGTAGETAWFYRDGSLVCTSTLSATDTGASCELQLNEGNNTLQVSLCTDTDTYSGNSCAQSDLVTVAAYNSDPLEPGEIQITTNVMERTFDPDLVLEWSIAAGNSVSYWSVFLNGNELCITSSDSLSYKSGSCQILDLPVGSNNISVIGCNYGYDDAEACVSSGVVSTERVALPNAPTITTGFPTAGEISQYTLSWVGASNGGSADHWLASVNGVDQCEAELTSAVLPQSGSCSITLENGDNEIGVRLCVVDSLDAASCTSSEIVQTELLATTPQTPEISTADQLINDDNILVEWSKPSGANGEYWLLSNNGTEVAACADQPILTTGDQQSGSCDLPLAIGANVIAVSLCNATTSSVACADSTSVTIERDWASPSFASADTAEVSENNTSVFYTVEASDNDSTPEQLTYTIAGADSSFFDFNTTTLELALSAPADYEQPGSFDSDNIYLLTFTATDETNLSTELVLTVNLTNVNDNAPAFAPELASVAQDENASISVDASASDPDQDALEYALGGADSALFTIDSSSGVIALDPILDHTTLDYESPQDANSDNVYELNVTAYDGISLVSQAIALSISNVNDNAPQFSASPAELSLAENDASVIYTASDFTSDVDADTLTYSLQGADAAAFDINSTSGELKFAQAPDYDNPSASGADPNLYQVDINASDGIYSSIQSLSIAVTNIDEAPAFTSSSLALTLPENDSSLFSGLTAIDPEGASVIYDLITDSGSADNQADAQYFLLDAASGELAFSSLSGADYELPQDYDGDGTYLLLIGATDGTNSIQQEISVTIQNVNEAPTYAQPSATLAVDENQAEVIYTSAASDPDSDTLEYTLSGADASAFDINSTSGELRFDPAPDYENSSSSGDANVYSIAITASDSEYQATESLTISVDNLNDETPQFTTTADPIEVSENTNDPITITATDADIDADPVAYTLEGTDAAAFATISTSGTLQFSFVATPNREEPQDQNQDNVYEIQVVASDSVNQSELDLEIHVLDVNEPHSFASASAMVEVDENNPQAAAIHTAVVVDPEQAQLNYSLSGADASVFSINQTNGEITFNSAPDHENPADADQDNTYNLEINVSDADYSATQQLTVEVSNLNDNHPEFTASPDTIDYVENDTSAIYLASSYTSDADGDTLAYSLSGTDSAVFSIVAASGELRFISAPDYDVPADQNQDNTYELEVVASDGAYSTPHSLQVQVSDINEPPTFASEKASESVYEGNDVDAVIYQAAATDPEQVQLVYSISGTDADDFNIGQQSGEIRFNLEPDFDSPADSDGDSVYELIVYASDGTYSADLELEVTVRGLNDNGPQFSEASVSKDYPEGSTAVVHTASDYASDPDGDQISYQLDGDDALLFDITSDTGAVSFLAVPDFEDRKDTNQDNVYDLIIIASDGAQSGSQILTISLTNVNEDPSFATASTSFTLNENDTTSLALAAASDPDGEDLTYSLPSDIGNQHDYQYFTLLSGPAIAFNDPGADYENSSDKNDDGVYEFILRASDGNLSSADHAITVTIADLNEAPLSSSASFPLAFDEGFNAVVHTASNYASDPDGDTLEYTLSGADAEDFSIISSSGAVSFLAIPDYENQQDQGRNNVYDITVVASDGELETQQTLTITIADINEAPAFDPGSTTDLQLSENDLSSLTLPAATDPDANNVITYSLLSHNSTTDYQYFALDTSIPSIAFNDPEADSQVGADYESPQDANGDQTYEFILRASDSELDTDLVITVTIENINETPVFTNGDSLSLDVDEDSSALVYTASATDPDSQSTIFYTASGADADDFSLDSASGELYFNPAPDFESPTDADQNNIYELTITASDGALESHQALTLTVIDLNEIHYFETSSSSFSLSENDPSSLDLPAVIDPDLSNSIIYQLVAIADGNNDYQSFDLSQSAGSAPSIAFADPNGADYENITDHNSDHIYEFVLQAADSDYSASHQVSVTITDIGGLTFVESSPLDLTFTENISSSIVVYTVNVDDAFGDVVIHSLGGVDSGDFNLDTTTGELKFKQSPDFENPQDQGQDNTYNVEISASDDETSATLELVIVVTDLEDLIPNTPTNLRATAADASVVLSWDSLESISNYTIYQSTSPDLSTSDFEETYTNIATSPETISGLTNATTYYFLITASNSVGTSSPSAVVSATPQAYALACPYPSATASKADTSALDCACTGSSANALLALSSEVSFSCADSQRNIVGNSVPDHAPGVFPNDGNPNAIAAVTGNYSHSLQPTWLDTEDTSEQIPGVARNGVKLEPETGETYQGDNAWRYEAIQDTLDLGLDEHHAHVQPTGMYHYHGMPEGHLDLIGISNAMILVGWARDGYPIYARYGYSDPLDSTSAIKVVSGSYAHRDLDDLNAQGRPSSDSERGLDSLPLGVFVADWEYVDGSGDLDECNGRYGVTPQFPDGIYHYYITDDYPYIQRCLKGNEAPAFTSASSVSVAENTNADSVIYTASAIDNGGDSFTFALNSDAHDSALFSIDPDSGELRFLTSPNYEFPHDGNGDNRYTVVIEADDGLAGGVAPLELEVTVTNDTGETSPYFTSDSVGSLTEDPDTEGQEIAVLALEVEVYDDDDDPAGRALSLELEGEDGSLFALAATSSANIYHANFITSPDFDFAHDANGDSTYSFTVVVTDSDANEVRHSATIVVDGINDEAPYINPEVYDGTAIYFPENNTSVIINLTGAGYDPDRTSWSDPNPYQPNQDSITFALTTHMSQSDSDLFYLDPDTLELSPKEPFDHENPKQLNSNDNSYWVEVALSDQAGNKNTVDGSEEGAGDRIVRVTISDIVDESAQPVESGPQIPWFNSSDLAAGADVAIPWVIYAGQGAINWDMYVNGNTECSYVVSDINSPVSSGTCIVSASKFTAGTTDNSAAVSVCDIDGNCATSESVIFGYAVSSTDGYYPSYPSNSGDASDCADVEVGEPVNSTNNSSCYNYLLSDDAFGGPYNEIPAYLKSDSGRNFDVIAYFIEWGVYERDFDTHDLPANLLSTALFSFIKFDGDRTALIDDEDEYRECEDCTFTGEVAIADTWAVFDKPYYKPGEEEKYEDEADDADHLAEILAEKGVSTGKGIFQQLWLLKQKFPHLKTCVSVGGWSFSRPFPLLRTQQGMLETFVDSIIDLAEQYHFDCIDIDWEFPGKAGGDHVDNNSAIVYDLDNDGNTPFINPTDEDADTFNELIAALRTEILSRNLDIEINSAVYTSTDGMAIMDYAAFSNDLHGIHMMTYDYYGAWDLFTGMQAALYPSADPVHGDVILREGYNPYNPDHNIASAMTRGVNNAMNKGFASNARIRQKIVPGLAFYGRNYSGVGRNGNPEPSSKRFMVPAERDGNGETKRFGWEAGNLNYIQLKGYYNHGDTVYGNADYITGYDQFGDPYTTGGYHWTYQWSDEAQTPFLFDDNYSVVSGSFISYTDPRAIYYQTCHAAWQNSKGVMFWEVSGDSEDFHLVNAIHAAVRGDDLVHDNYTNNPSCTDLDQIDHGDIVYGEAAGGGDGDGDGDGDGGDGDGGNGGSSSEGLAGLVELGYIDESTFNSMFPHRNNDPSSTAQGVDTYTWDGFSKAAAEFTAAGFLNVGSTDDRLRELAAFLANTSHETGNSTGSYALSNIGGGIGNTRYDAGYYFQQEQYCAAGGSGYGYTACDYCELGFGYDYACDWLYADGNKFDYYYYGRGPLQLSYNYNYGPFSEYYYNGDADVLLYDANKMLEDSEVAFASALWFWMTVQSPKPSMHQVMVGTYEPSLEDQSLGRYPGFGMSINVLNGGVECGATPSAGTAAYDKIRNRLGYYLTYLNLFSAKQNNVGISPWVGEYALSTPATSLDFPTDDESLLVTYPDANKYLGCSEMYNYQ